MYMSDVKIAKTNLANQNPDLATQWHPHKNGELTPYDIAPKSSKKVWWICSKGHEWEASVGHRSKGSGCPFCAGKRASRENCLQTLNPELSKQWHSIKNGNKTPSDVTAFSNKKAWWVCDKGHEYEAAINGRMQGSGCPYCSGKRAYDGNSLQTLYPEIAKEWHPSKNRELTPSEITTGTHTKIWWLCDKGHEWSTAVHNRIKGNGCPYCSGRYATEDNSLQILNPELASEWHPTKNGELTPNNVKLFTNTKVWWVCSNGHEWKASVEKRSMGQGCPYCSGRRVCMDNCLQTLNPYLAGQWHPSKNGELTPSDVTIGANKKVWWQCEQGHEWETAVLNRSNGTGCPICSQGTQTSFPEQAIFYYLKNSFEDAVNRYKFENKWEIDIFVPSLNFGIEYDGLFYHQTKEESDLKKEENIAEGGVRLLRVRESREKLDKCYAEGNVIYCSKNPSESNLNDAIEMCFGYISENITNKPYEINVDVKRDRNNIYNLYIVGVEDDSLLKNHPEVAKQWHPTKNSKIKPSMVKSGSDKKVWWLCEKGHEWEMRVADRAKGVGCPFCAGKRACADNSLQALNPKLAKQWHPVKNGKTTPDNVTTGSGKKVWWVCEKGHEWDATITSRATNGNGCPFCSGQRACSENSLNTLNPNLAKEWHPSRNGSLTPNDVTTGSGKKVWWLCKKEHEWEASIASRASRVDSTGCPYCSGNRVCSDNSLQSLNPELSKEWHPNKNGNLTPDDVTMRSSKKVWWLCAKGHEWETNISHRSNGSGCPYCHKVKKRNASALLLEKRGCLNIKNPQLSEQWHPTKNGNLTPNDVTAGSNKKVWWICKEGHEWDATIKSRNNGRGCPFCSGRKKLK